MQYPKVFNDNKFCLASDVQSAKKVDAASGSVSDAGQTNLIINYLPADMTENELFELFCKIGEVAKHKIVRNRRTGESLGYGFVEFKTASAARVAQIMCNRHVIRGKSLKVAFARPRSQDIINANLYVTHLPPDVDESKLATLFGCYGTIIEVKVLRSKYTGKSVGSGFVRFDQRLAAEVATKALDNYVLSDGTRPISVKFANGQNQESQLPAKRFQEPCPFSRPIKREMEPEIEQTAKRLQEPCHFPLAIKRQMEPEIEQTGKRIQEPYPFPPLAKRHMEYNIQQTEIQQDAMRSQAYPWLVNRPTDSGIEQFSKRAYGYAVPHKE